MSSIDPTAYDALGRILSSGGEMSLALAMARGYSDSAIGAMMLRKFGGDYTAASGSLGGFALDMIAAGELANQRQSSGGQIDASEVPINGFLPDEEMGGTRFKWAADVTFEGASSAVTVYGYSVSGDIAEMVEEALAGGIGIVDNYRTRFGLAEDENINWLTIQFLAMEGNY